MMYRGHESRRYDECVFASSLGVPTETISIVSNCVTSNVSTKRMVSLYKYRGSMSLSAYEK